MKKYFVDILENSIHIEPVKKSAEESAAGCETAAFKSKAEVYGWPNGKLDIMMKKLISKIQKPTLTKVAGFPFATLMQSNRRFNLVISCSKDEVKLLETEMLLHRDSWFEAMQAAIDSQKLGESPEQLDERINNIKKEGGFV